MRSEQDFSMSVPEISVILPCFNEADTISDQLNALVSQLGAPPFEVVVIDNGSSDSTRTVAMSFASRLNLTVISAAEAQGASYARNVGVSAARSPLLMFCDADDVVSQWWVEQGKKTFEITPFWSGSGIPVDDSSFSRSLAEIREAIGDSRVWQPPALQSSSFPILLGGNFGITLQEFTRVGGFDQSFATAGDDNDFAFRAQRLGLNSYISPTVRLAYRTRTDPRARRRFVFRAARAHVLLATRYDVWEQSHLRNWLPQLARAIAAGSKMVMIPRVRDWTSLGERFSTIAGILDGIFWYRLLKKMPLPLIGVGYRAPGSPLHK